MLTNHRSDVPLIVRNLDRPAERFRVFAKQGAVTIPFVRAEVAGTHGWVLKIAKVQTQEIESMCDDDQLRAAWGLDPDSIAHSIMYMLTQHVVEGTENAPPSTREIADQHLITPDTVRDHYARLLKLLGAEDFEDPRTGDGRREALINYARNHVYVRP